MYSIWNNKIKKILKAQTKYADKDLIFDHHNWTKYYLIPFKCVKDTALILCQYRLLHRILGTNTFLHNMIILVIQINAPSLIIFPKLYNTCSTIVTKSENFGEM